MEWSASLIRYAASNTHIYTRGHIWRGRFRVKYLSLCLRCICIVSHLKLPLSAICQSPVPMLPQRQSNLEVIAICTVPINTCAPRLHNVLLLLYNNTDSRWFNSFVNYNNISLFSIFHTPQL